MEPDEIIHQSLRLKIMSALHAAGTGEPTEFTRLKKLVDATDGNLGSHLGTLEKAGYVRIDKDHVGKRPRTRAAITAKGKTAFAHHVAYLQSLIDHAGVDTP